MKFDYDEINKKIDELLINGVRNRNKILNQIASEDEELDHVLDLCRMRKSETEIVIALKRPVDVIRKDIEILDTISRLTDSKITSIQAKKFYINMAIGKNMPHNTNDELNKSITNARKMEIYKKSDARKFLKKYFFEYMQNRKNGVIDKDKLISDLDKIEKNINLLGCQNSDVFYLVSIYIDIGVYKKAEAILNAYNPQNLSEVERKNYHILKDRTKKTRNKHFIKNLCELGYTPQQIYEICEKEVSEYRAPYLDLGFISSMLEKNFGYSANSTNKSNCDDNKNENKKEEKDELEL